MPRKEEDDFIFYWEKDKKDVKKSKQKKMVYEDELDPFEFTIDIPGLPVQDMSFPMEIVDNGDHMVIRAHLPGFEKENVDVNINKDFVEIVARKEQDEIKHGKKSYSKKSSQSTMRKSFDLPKGIFPEKAFARMDKGFLTIIIPKKKKRDWFD